MGLFGNLFFSKKHNPPFKIYDEILTAPPGYYADLSFDSLSNTQVDLVRNLNNCIQDFFERQAIFILENEKTAENLSHNPAYVVACFFEVSILSYLQIIFTASAYKTETKFGKALFDCIYYTFRNQKIFKAEYENNSHFAFTDRIDIYEKILLSLMNPKSDAMLLSNKIYDVMIKSPAQPYQETIEWNFIQAQIKKAKYWTYFVGSLKTLNDCCEKLIKNYR